MTAIISWVPSQKSYQIKCMSKNGMVVGGSYHAKGGVGERERVAQLVRRGKRCTVRVLVAKGQLFTFFSVPLDVPTFRLAQLRELFLLLSRLSAGHEAPARCDLIQFHQLTAILLSILKDLGPQSLTLASRVSLFPLGSTKIETANWDRWNGGRREAQLARSDQARAGVDVLPAAGSRSAGAGTSSCAGRPAVRLGSVC